MARERYLLNAGDDTIHDNEIKPATAREKRKNWWFYHKGHVLLAVIGAGLLFSIVYSIVSKVEPDYTVALITSYTMPESGRTELERCISAYADDRNGDGKVVVRVSNYTFSPDNATSSEMVEQQQAELTRFMADCVTNESMIFLHDEKGFNCMKANFNGFFLYNSGETMPEDAEDYENAMRPWSDFTAFSEFVPEVEENAYQSYQTFDSEMLLELFGRLRVSVRAREGSSIERKEKDVEYYQDSMELYRRLESGEAYAAVGEP